jgi:hypothetical protein
MGTSPRTTHGSHWNTWVIPWSVEEFYEKYPNTLKEMAQGKKWVITSQD